MTACGLALAVLSGTQFLSDAFRVNHDSYAQWARSERLRRHYLLQPCTFSSSLSSSSVHCSLSDEPSADDVGDGIDHFAFPGLLDDIDDSVFDSPHRRGGRERSTPAKEERRTFSAKSTLTTTIRGLDVSGELKRGDRIRVQVKRIDKLGVYVELLDHEISQDTLVRGMILKIEADL